MLDSHQKPTTVERESAVTQTNSDSKRNQRIDLKQHNFLKAIF